MRQWDLAIEQTRNTIELDPQRSGAHLVLGFALIQKGKLDEAIRSLENARKFSGLNPFRIGSIGLAYALLDQKDRAQQLLDQLQELHQKTYIPPSSFGNIYLGIGKIDEAFDWFEKAAEEHDGSLFTVPSDVAFDTVRSNRRYKALLRKMNLEP